MIGNLFICLIPAVVVVLMGIRKIRERSWGYCSNNVMLNDKVAIVTGASSGIGFEVAKELAARTAQVILACRNINSARQAIVNIERELKRNVKMIALELDLASLESIKQFAIQVQEMYPKIHILINNAGVSYPKNELHFTNDGFEIHIGVNHLGHFYLTNLLLKTLIQSAPSRVVVVSSSLHEKGKIDIASFTQPKVGLNYYANSKLANVYFCKELAKRTEGTGLNIYAVCPGWVYTSLFRHAIKWYHYILVAPIAFFFMRSPKQGSQTVIYCATEPCLKESGQLYRNCAKYHSRKLLDEIVSENLWEESERLINKMLK